MGPCQQFSYQLCGDTTTPIFTRDNDVFDLPIAGRATRNDKPVQLRYARFANRDQRDSWWSIGREQGVVFALCPMGGAFRLLLQRVHEGHIVGGGGTNQHERQCFGVENISASERRM